MVDVGLVAIVGPGVGASNEDGPVVAEGHSEEQTQEDEFHVD